MALSLDRINTELNSFARRFDFDNIAQAQSSAQFTQLSAEMSQLGTQVGEVVGGFQSITQELDIPPEVLTQALAVQQASTAAFTDGTAYDLQEELQNVAGVVNRGVVILAENPPGLEIQNDVSSLNSSLEAITEGTVGGGFNHIAVTANTPEAMARTMSRVASVPLTQTQQAVNAVVPQIPALVNNVPSIVTNLQNNLSVINQLTREVNSFFNTANNILNMNSITRGLLNNVVQSLTRSVENDIRALLNIDSNIPSSTLNSAVELVEAGEYEQAVIILQPYTDLNSSDLLISLQSIDLSVSRDVTSTTATNTQPTPSISPTQRPENPGQPITENSIVYGIISSIDRDITEIVFKTVSINDLSSGIEPTDYPNWHLIIQSDGVINRSAALNTLLDVPGHESYSIGIIVAARNNTITADQTQAIDRIMRAFFSLIPHGQIVNFAEINSQVRVELIYDFVEHASEHFNYRSIMDDLTSSLSTEQIQLRIRAAATAGTPHIDD